MAKQTFTTGQVLTAAQMTSLQANDYNQTVSAKVASYVLVATDAGTRITMSNASATTITVNTALFTAGDTLTITNIGAGVCTITAGTATVSTAGSLALNQYDSGTLYFTSTGVSIWNGANPGDITGVTAGVGITGGGTSGTVTVTNDMATTITTAGDLIKGTGSGTYNRLGIGSTGQVLTVASGAPSWATVSASSGPTFSAYPTGTNQSIPPTTFTKVLFGTEAWDTASNFASSRFTPTTAGYYQINATVYFIGLNAANDAYQLWKNGSTYFEFKNVTVGTFSINISQVVYLNGSSDYLEVYLYKNGGGNCDVQVGQAYTNFNGVWIRS